MLETGHVCLVSVKYGDEQVLDVRDPGHGTPVVQTADRMKYSEGAEIKDCFEGFI